MATDEEQRELFKLWQCRNCGRWLSPVACPLHCPYCIDEGIEVLAPKAAPTKTKPAKTKLR